MAAAVNAHTCSREKMCMINLLKGLPPRGIV
jgi:hypothetical protein